MSHSKSSQIALTAARPPKGTYLLWDALLSAMLLGGGLAALAGPWGSLMPAWYGPAAAALAAWGLCRLAGALREKETLAWCLRLLPWPVLILILGPGDLWQGLLFWLNCTLSNWNRIHEGALALFRSQATEQGVLALSVLASFAMGQLVHRLVYRRRLFSCAIFSLALLVLQLLGGTLSPQACALCFGAFLGLWMVGKEPVPSRQVLRAWSLTVAVLVLCAALAPRGELSGVTQFRQEARRSVHTLRYGQDSLPEGRLRQAGKLNRSTEELLQVKTGQIKNLYLRGYVAGDYRDGSWSPLPDSTYGGDNAGMLDWLRDQGFDPLTQVARYYELSQDQPEENEVQVAVSGASRYYLYTPISAASLAEAPMKPEHDSRFRTTGFFGKRWYTVEELSYAKPAELTIREDWVESPETEERLQYTKAEAVYREFVYQNYLKVDADLNSMLQEMFWDGEEGQTVGVYGALNRIRQVLRRNTGYTQNPASGPEAEDPIVDFLTGVRRGNAVQYATAAVLALRSRGIPARYVEGYYISEDNVRRSGDGNLSLTGANAHAWAEVYFDGIGWMPVDVTPGYYLDALALQEMVSLPDTVQKAVLEEDSENGGSEVEGDGDTGTQGVHEPLETLKNITLAILGVLALAVIVLTFLFLLLELLRALVDRRIRTVYAKASTRERVRLLQQRIYDILAVWGVDACLGWNASETDKAVTERIPSLEAGSYLRVSGLLEKALYGDRELEPAEIRTLRAFLEKLSTTARRGTAAYWRIRYSRLFLIKASEK